MSYIIYPMLSLSAPSRLLQLRGYGVIGKNVIVSFSNDMKNYLILQQRGIQNNVNI